MEERIIINLGQMYSLCLEFPPINGMGWGFRGQSNADWPLLSKAGRAEFFDSSWNVETQEQGYDRPPKDLGRFREWKEKAIAFCSDLPKDDYECLAYAQHHGLATRLMDWTHNPLVALYFAVQASPGKDGAVYAYFLDCLVEPNAVPLESLPQVAVYMPRPIHQRILMQQGFFTVHPQPEIPLESGPIPPELKLFTQEKTNLMRFRVPAGFKQSIQGELQDFGINHYVLFPGIDGLSEFINWGTKRGVTAANNQRS